MCSLGTVLLHLFAVVLLHRARTPLGADSTNPDAPAATTNNDPSTSQSTPLASLPKIRSLYVTCDAPFEEVETFVEECCNTYNLDLVRIGGGIKEALAQYLGPASLSQSSTPAHLSEHVARTPAPGAGIRALLMGTRRGDPYSGKSSCSCVYSMLSMSDKLCSPFGLRRAH